MKSFSHAAVLLILLLPSGCGDTFESLGNEMVGVFDEMAELLKGVTDTASAEKAVPELERLARRMQEVSRRLEDLKDSSLDGVVEKSEEIQARLNDAMNRLTRELSRVSDIPGAMDLIDGAVKKAGF